MNITYKTTKIATLELDEACCIGKNNRSYEIIDTKGEYNGDLEIYFKSYAKDEYCVTFSDDYRIFDTMEDAADYIAKAMIIRNQFPALWEDHMENLEHAQETHNYSNVQMASIPWKLPTIPE